jgi:S-(hydroxymethyl)glutathione dehydrogenase/alcohol dehydrogenase
MKAAICYEFDKPVRVEEVTLDRPGSGEVRVRIQACGVCHSDLSVIHGVLRSKLPCVLGHEGAGIVEEVGEGVTELKPGDKVVLSWVMSCSRCFYCRIGKPQLCELGEKINKWNTACPTGRRASTRARTISGSSPPSAHSRKRRWCRRALR